MRILLRDVQQVKKIATSYMYVILMLGNLCFQITDFGLAKLLDLDEDEYKAEGGKMPIKWYHSIILYVLFSSDYL